MKEQATQKALQSLQDLQQFTRDQYPIGTVVKSRRGRGLAEFTVTGYPQPTSMELANSVEGLSKNEKTQILNTASFLEYAALPVAE